jgi:hypothetical protein
MKIILLLTGLFGLVFSYHKYQLAPSNSFIGTVQTFSGGGNYGAVASDFQFGRMWWAMWIALSLFLVIMMAIKISQSKNQ